MAHRNAGRVSGSFFTTDGLRNIFQAARIFVLIFGPCVDIVIVEEAA